MKNLLLCLSFISIINSVFSQEEHHSHSSNRKIEFPDIEGYKTLICDFHIHTVFSDGEVWPSIRVKEALRDGLDAISLTEHLEYQPHKNDIPHKDRNREYEIAKEHAKNHDLIVVNGSEITRSMPPGHSNAIFLNDSNKLLVDDVLEAFQETKRQDAFVFWNHPHFLSQAKDGVARLSDMHKELIRKNLLHGIEVVNDQSYSDEALQIALDNNLTIMGTSDVHELVDWVFKVPEGGHRPVTLVFAKEKNAQSIKEALVKKRTVVYFKDFLIGRKEFLVPLIQTSLHIEEVKYRDDTAVLLVELKNESDVDFILKNKMEYTFHESGDVIVVKSKGSILLNVKVLERKKSFNLKFEVLNAILAPDVHPEINFNIEIK